MKLCCWSSDARPTMAADAQLAASDSGVRRFSLSGIVGVAKCVRVYDGDSVHLVMRYKGELVKFACRLSGIDAAEMRGGDPIALRARDRLRELTLDKLVNVECHQFDKYGRLLVDIYVNGDHVNRLMIDEQLARSYHGGARGESSNV